MKSPIKVATVTGVLMLAEILSVLAVFPGFPRGLLDGVLLIEQMGLSVW